MAETVDEFLVDFYKKKNNEDISLDKIKTIKQTYGNDYDSLIKDLYKKYDNEGLSDEKLKNIKQTYELSPTKVSQEEVEIKAEEKVVPLSEQDLTDEQKDINQYTNRLVEVSNAKFSEEQKNAALKIAEEDGYSDFLKQARQNLEVLNEPITPASLKEKAIELSVLSQEDAWQQEQADEILEEFETEFGIDRIGGVENILESAWNLSNFGMIWNNVSSVKALWDKYIDEDITKEEKQQHLRARETI